MAGTIVSMRLKNLVSESVVAKIVDDSNARFWKDVLGQSNHQAWTGRHECETRYHVSAEGSAAQDWKAEETFSLAGVHLRGAQTILRQGDFKPRWVVLWCGLALVSVRTKDALNCIGGAILSASNAMPLRGRSMPRGPHAFSPLLAPPLAYSFTYVKSAEGGSFEADETVVYGGYEKIYHGIVHGGFCS